VTGNAVPSLAGQGVEKNPCFRISVKRGCHVGCEPLARRALVCDEHVDNVAGTHGGIPSPGWPQRQEIAFTALIQPSAELRAVDPTRDVIASPRSPQACRVKGQADERPTFLSAIDLCPKAPLMILAH